MHSSRIAENVETKELECKPGKTKRPKIVWDANGILVLYKPPFWTMTTTFAMPRARSIQAWLIDNVGHRHPFLRKDPLQAGLVQRLDVETSGLVVVATREKSFNQAWQLRQKGEFYREYYALLHGLLPVDDCIGTLHHALRSNGYTTRVCEHTGLPATTCYQAIGAYTRRVADPRGEPGRQTLHYTLVRARILSGRTHQIRVHLRELARELNFETCGLVGDYRYLPREMVDLDKVFCPRVFLHAKVLRFPLPGTKGDQRCSATCALPADLAQVLAALTPDEEMTAKFKQVADTLAEGVLSPEQAGSVFGGYPRDVDVFEHSTYAAKRARSQSRSPSHWDPDDGSEGSEAQRACSPDAGGATVRAIRKRRRARREAKMALLLGLCQESQTSTVELQRLVARHHELRCNRHRLKRLQKQELAARLQAQSQHEICAGDSQQLAVQAVDPIEVPETLAAARHVAEAVAGDEEEQVAEGLSAAEVNLSELQQQLNPAAAASVNEYVSGPDPHFAVEGHRKRRRRRSASSPAQSAASPLAELRAELCAALERLHKAGAAAGGAEAAVQRRPTDEELQAVQAAVERLREHRTAQRATRRRL